jgi:hypothetical protein
MHRSSSGLPRHAAQFRNDLRLFQMVAFGIAVIRSKAGDATRQIGKGFAP